MIWIVVIGSRSTILYSFRFLKQCVMKQLSLYTFLLLLLGVSMQSCFEDKCNATQRFTQFDPVYLSLAQIRQPITFDSPRELLNVGKLYLYKDYLFINELGEGVHVYDNSDDTDPISIGFLTIPGNFDIAIQNDVLYADNVMDFVSIDITNLTNPVLIDRAEEAFYKYSFNNQYLAYYRESKVVQVVDCQNANFGGGWFFEGDVLFANDAAGGVVSSESANSNVSGTGGSTARFTLVNDYLYTIDQSNLTSWNIDAGAITLGSTQNLGWGIETIFPYEDNLFIGSNTGMFIFDNSNQSNPTLLSTFRHARACDPVVVSGNTAYVTLRNGSFCESFTNQLDVIDITDLLNPTLIKTFAMENPHGLSIRNNFLYICEGDYGLKIFDASDSDKISDNLVSNLKNIKATDIITLPNDRALVIGKDGLIQYDISDKESPVLLSTITTSK